VCGCSGGWCGRDGGVEADQVVGGVFGGWRGGLGGEFEGEAGFGGWGGDEGLQFGEADFERGEVGSCELLEAALAFCLFQIVF
jgi:hypothetical protein